MNAQDVDAVVKRANAAGHASLAEYAVALEESLLKIARQGTGHWDQEQRCMVDANGERWFHWATRAEMAVAPREVGS